MEEFRRLGNEAFESAQYKQAINYYSQALGIFYRQTGIAADQQTNKLLRGNSGGGLTSFLGNLFLCGTPQNVSQDTRDAASIDPSSGAPVGLSTEQLELFQPHIILSNRAAALAHLSAFSESLHDAELAIRYQPNWPKGFYRRAEALNGLERLEEALSSYKQCLSMVSTLNSFDVFNGRIQLVAMKYVNKQDASAKLVQKRIQLVGYQISNKHMGIEIIQLLAGRDFAVSTWSPISKLIFNFAKSLQNFVYAICCRQTKQCVLVDVCWDVDGILRCVRNAGYEVVGAIVTHYHFDHVGGKPPAPYDQYRIQVDGLATLLRRLSSIPAYIHRLDIAGVQEANECLPMDRIVCTDDGYELNIGETVHLRFIHTPGHTAGSQCLLLNDCRLFSGDTLFISSIGRLDFPDSDARQMFDSMQKLRALTGDIMVLPGHSYGGDFTTLDWEKERNLALRSTSFREFKEFSLGEG